jgi:trimeric autotransporter adhesin
VSAENAILILTKPSRLHAGTMWTRIVSILMLLLGMATVFSSAAQPTVTMLAVTSSGSAVTTVSSGSVVTLTATVTSGSAAVTAGQVIFCDATAAHCEGIHILGTSQLTKAGTTTNKFRPGVGSHSYKAVFAGTTSESSSASSVGALTVTGLYPTATAIAQSGSAGNYKLTATVGSTASKVPTGTVSFLDTSNGSAVVGTASLGAGITGPSLFDISNPAFDVSSSARANGDPVSTLVADFNGDGIPDLAVLALGSTTITILLGNGDGTFTAAPAIPTTGSFPDSIAVGDFNQDGKLDLAVLNSALNAVVTILLGNGDGTFTASSASPEPGQSPGILAVGDFNGDGIPDLAVTNTGEPFIGDWSVVILLGNGDGTFTNVSSPISSGPFTSPSSVAIGDFNGDGIQDLAVGVYRRDQAGILMILLGKGDGTFTAASASPELGCSPSSIAVEDFNGDGIPDLAVANIGNAGCPGGSGDVLLGNGDGTFTAASALPVSGNVFFSGFTIAVGDFNGDGKPDLAVGTLDPNQNGTVTILFGNGDGTFAPASASPILGPVPSFNSLVTLNFVDPMAIGDFNGDGVPDLAVMASTSNTISISILQTATQSAATAPTDLTGPVGTGTHQVVASYSGDSNNKASISTSSVAVTAPPSFAISGTPVAIAPGVTTGNTSTITLTPSGGFTGPISLSCAITPAAARDPATCSLPASVTITGAAAQTTTLTVNTTAATSALNQTRKLLWPSAGSAILACILIVGIPARRRKWRRILAMLLLLFSITAGVLACGGGGAGNPGTTPGTYTITVIGTAGSLTKTGSVTLTVK